MVALICIFMMSNEVETFFFNIGHLAILFCGHLFKYFAYFFICVGISFLLVRREWSNICCTYFISGEFLKF